MILAGIDEAGYGPLLGPLVVGCAAFEIESADPAEPPCLWKRLGTVISKNRCRRGRKIHVNDSKLVYTPAEGLKDLERSVLAMTTAWSDLPGCVDAFVERVAPAAVDHLRRHPWYLPVDGETFPIEQEAIGIRLLANGLKIRMQETGAKCVHLAARVVPERQFNDMVHNTRNKASALFSIAAVHLDHLLRTYGHRGLVIFCDRQGGRSHYGSLLRLMFDTWALEVTSETESRADYALRQGDAVVRIIFCEKAEGQCMPVAMASMLSKYLREAMMRRFNAFWSGHVPNLEPTAGYYNDGLRFLKDIAAARQQLGVEDAMLVRSR